jgi:hypothetical protein
MRESGFIFDKLILTTSATYVPTGTGPAESDIANYSYAWDFDDGEADSAERNPSYTYTNAGVYAARLTVTDSASATAFDTVAIFSTGPPGPGDLNGDGLINAQDINPFVLALTDFPAWQATYPQLNVLVVGDIGGPGQTTPPFTPDGLFNAQDINPFVYLLTNPTGGVGQVSATEAPTAEHTEAELASPAVGQPIAAAKAPRGKSRAEVMAPVFADALAVELAGLDGDAEVDLFELPAIRRRNFGQAARPNSAGEADGLGDELIDVLGLLALAGSTERFD